MASGLLIEVPANTHGKGTKARITLRPCQALGVSARGSGEGGCAQWI
jgi:hypothetical protein